jgi:hypothetical protein
LGFVLDISSKKLIKSSGLHSQERQNANDAELFLLVHCDQHLVGQVEQALWDHLALGVAVIPNN